MSTFGLSASGFLVKQQQDIIDELRASLQSGLGKSINLLPEAIFGHIVGIVSEREALVWQLAEAVYDSQYPEGAEGASVDNILALNGLKRLPATSSKATLYLFGTPGTLVPINSIVSLSGNALVQFKTDADATIAAAVNAVQILNFTAVPDVGNFKIKIGSLSTANIPYTANAAAVQTAVRLLTGYSAVVVTGSYASGFTITFAGSSGAQAQPLIEITNNTLQQGATVVNVSVIDFVDGAPAQAIIGATCTVTGPTSAPSGFLTVIGTPVSGWATVNNPLDAVAGTNIESDTDALIRRRESLQAQANGPLQSIVDKVSLVSGVTQAIGFENTTLITDGSGLPGKAFEIVAQGGVNADIAASIYASKPAGILAYGSVPIVVVDKFGFSHTISFSRPTLVPIYVSIAITKDSAVFPSDGVQTIQQEIVAIGNALKIGATVILFGSNGLVGAFNNVPGITTYTLKAGTSPGPTLSNNIPLTSRQLAEFDTSFIVVSFV